MKDVSIPIEETNGEVNKKLKEEIRKGNVNIGELVVPQTFNKISLVDNELKTEEVSIEGRKIPLLDFRKSSLKKHKKLMKLRSDEDFNSLTLEDIITELKKIGEYQKTDKHDDREILVKQLQETTKNTSYHVME